MDSGFIQFLTTQVGLGGVAALALWLNNRAYQDALRREREYSDASREDKRAMMDVMQANTKALAALESAIENMTGRERGQRNTPRD